MTKEIASVRDQIDLGFSVLAAWIGTLLGLGYHGIWSNNANYLGIELPGLLRWYSIVTPAIPLLAISISAVALILARRKPNASHSSRVRLIVNLGWLVGVMLPITTIVLWELPHMLIGTKL